MWNFPHFFTGSLNKEAEAFPLFRLLTEVSCFQEVPAAAGDQDEDQERVRQEARPAGGAQRQDRRKLHTLRQTPRPQNHQKAEKKIRVENASY